jgi:hypothetical protein
MMIQKTRLQRFYDNCLSDSAIVDSGSMKRSLEEIEGFDWEEFNKPINSLDM